MRTKGKISSWKDRVIDVLMVIVLAVAITLLAIII